MKLHKDVKDSRVKRRFKTLEEECNAKHSSKYSYIKSIYKNARTPMIVTCPVHGDWETTPDNHLRGTGCPVCSPAKKSSTEEFIVKATKVHEDRYIYKDVVYETAKKKVEILCEVHGNFSQTPNDHLSGKGCMECAKENRATTSAFGRDRFEGVQTILYYIEIFEGIFKIGLTTKTIKKRFAGREVKTIYSKTFEDGGEAYDIEQKILKETRDTKVPKDFKFKIHGWTEFRTEAFIDKVLKECH